MNNQIGAASDGTTTATVPENLKPLQNILDIQRSHGSDLCDLESRLGHLIGRLNGDAQQIDAAAETPKIVPAGFLGELHEASHTVTATTDRLRAAVVRLEELI